MAPAELQALVEHVLSVSALFGGLTFVVMEFVVKRLIKGRTWRQIISVALPIAATVIYLGVTQTLPWAYAPLIAFLAFGSAWLTHKQRNANEE